MAIKDVIYQFIIRHKLAVVSTVNDASRPECALVGIAVSDQLEIIFDTVTSSRKYANILENAYVALAIGWDDEITVQYEGRAEVLGNHAEADKYREIYYSAWPDGRERTESWPDLIHIKITPEWIRYSNFNDPLKIEEIRF
jgi:general stress protein 26